MAKSGVKMSWGGLDKKLMSATVNLGNTNELMDNIGEALVSGTIQRFEDEESPDGKTWKKSKRASRDKGKTLSDKGELRKSISYKKGGDKIHVGSISKYARIHQFGGMAGRGRKLEIDARPFIGISDEDKEEIQATIGDFIAGAFR